MARPWLRPVCRRSADPAGGSPAPSGTGVPLPGLAFRPAGVFRRSAAIAAVLWWTATAWAGPAGPRVDHVFPAGGPAGGIVALRVAGDFTGWPAEVWTDAPGLRIIAGAAPGHFSAEIAPNTPPGPHLIRFFDATGASAPRQFVVGDTPEPVAADAAEAAATLVIPPAAVHGRFDGGQDPVRWSCELPAGATLRLEAMATRLDSPGTVRLRLLDAENRLLGESTTAPPADPELRCLVIRSGRYQVEISPVWTNTPPALSPADPLIYRVQFHLTGPAGPAGGSPSAGAFEGTLRPDSNAGIRFDEAPVAPTEPVLHPEMVSPTESQPGSFAGFINPAGDEDRFGFVARRDEIHRFRVRLAQPDSPLLPVIRVLEGNRLLAETTPGSEGALTWLAAADGAYTIAVADARGEGGPDYAYELELLSVEPRLAALATDHTWRVPAGGRLAVPVQIERPEAHRGALLVSAFGLAVGVRAEAGLVLPGAATAELVLSVDDPAPATSQPFQMVMLDPTAVPPRSHVVLAPVRGRHAPPGGLLINETDTFWLTVGTP